MKIIVIYFTLVLITWLTIKYFFKKSNPIKTISFWITSFVILMFCMVTFVINQINEIFTGLPPDKGWNRKYYENGQMKSEFFIENRKIKGLKRTWYSNGQLESVANYKKGFKTDTAFYYYADGTINYLTVNIEKKEVYNVNYYPTGKLRSEIYRPNESNIENYKIDYHTNGNKKFETRINTTTYEGKGFYYFRNENIKYEGYYKNANMNGIWLKRDSITGNILEKDTFDFKQGSGFKDSWDWNY